MKKSIFYILPAVLLLGACTKNIESYNDQTKKAAVVPAAPLFTYGTRTLSDQLATNSGANSTNAPQVLKLSGRSLTAVSAGRPTIRADR